MIILGVYGAFDWDGNKSKTFYGDPSWTHDSGTTLFVIGNYVVSK